MKSLIFLMAPVQDSINCASQVHIDNSFIIIILIVFGIYAGLIALFLFLNRLLKNTQGYCDNYETAFIPIGNLFCIICRLKQFVTPKVINDFRKNNIKKKTESNIKKKKEIEAKAKERTKGLIDI